MTLFRKYYREANNYIKPDEAFVNSVIANAKRRKPPAYSRYTKYAASIAAAVVVVSGAVISMPVWHRVETDKEDIIVDEVISATATPESTANAALPPAATAAPSPKSAQSALPKRTSEHSYINAQKSETKEQSAEDTSVVSESAADTVQEETASDEANASTELKREVADSENYEAVEYSSAAESAAPPVNASEMRSAKTAVAEDSDIPTPEGYYCTSASPYGYTFQNDDGAVIIVTIGYGGEESAPYYSEDGGNIYATAAAFGMTVTVNASGADMSTVREIIEAFR